MKITKTCTLIIGICFMSMICSAQETESTNPMNEVEHLIGKWSGKGWMTGQDRQRRTFSQTEDIYTKLGGKILVVNGEGTDLETGKVEFQAFGVLHFDQESQEYTFNAYTHEGNHVEASTKIGDGSFEWWFDTPQGGTVKYAIKFTETTWIEDGNYSPDGQNWYPFFHMELQKLK